MRSIDVCGYAKINLFLDIFGKRKDGYHELKTVMQTVSLCDELKISLDRSADAEIIIGCDNGGVPTGEENIVYRAARLFFEKYGGAKAEFFIRKRIPMAAGLAGGSADAAAALRGLNLLYGQPADIGELCEIGLGLGADVPFCTVGGCCLAEGVGERLTRLPSMPDRKIIIAVGGEGVSTPRAYGELDADNGNFGSYALHSEKLERLVSAVNRGDGAAICGNTFNIFESTVLKRHETAQNIKKLMLECGADSAMMSGSGPSVFGIFGTDSDTENLKSKIKSLGCECFECNPIENIGG